jgi:hypothetical protein
MPAIPEAEGSANVLFTNGSSSDSKLPPVPMVGLIYPNDLDYQPKMSSPNIPNESLLPPAMTDEATIEWFRQWAMKTYPCESCGFKLIPLELAQQVF